PARPINLAYIKTLPSADPMRSVMCRSGRPPSPPRATLVASAGTMAATISPRGLSKQRRPGRIRSILRRLDRPLVVAGQINRIKPCRTVAARVGRRLTEIHYYPAIWRPGRALDQKVLSQNSLAGAIGPHDPDSE